ncbi:MAG: Sir2 family NAD-dependent protein deacetylase [bacterium]
MQPRADLQDRLVQANPSWVGRIGAANADGDAELDADTSAFVVPPCLTCGGVLKPRVVFFGENVPPRSSPRPARLDRRRPAGGGHLPSPCGRGCASCGPPRPAACHRLRQPGPTRGDPELTLRLEARTGVALPALARALLGRSPG